MQNNKTSYNKLLKGVKSSILQKPSDADEETEDDTNRWKDIIWFLD